MPRLPRVSSGELLRALRRAGWQEQGGTGGSHRQLVHPDKPGRKVTVAFHAGAIIQPRILKSILTQAGMTAQDLRDLL